MKPLRLHTYKQHLEKAGYAPNTIKQYMSCMDTLKQAGIYEDSTSQEVYDAINTDDRKGNTKLMYLKAVTEYEKGVIGKANSMLNSALRFRLAAENKDDALGKTPKKSVKAYRNIITRCERTATRVALRLQLESGLRAGEISALTPRKITMREGHIWLKVDPQKTEYGRNVKVFDNPVLYEELTEFLKEKAPDDTLFPSAQTLYDYMISKGGASHDLRRHNARLRYIEQRIEGEGKEAALEEVGRQLGHKDLDNTIRYLGSVYRNDKGGKYRKDVTYA